MRKHKVHYVNPELERIFLWTNRVKTSCGKIYEKIQEYSTEKEHINCKKCKNYLK